MKKTILFAMLMILGSCFAFAQTLIFSDDFESYEVSNSTWHTATSNWLCGDYSSGNCVFSVSSPPGDANASQYIRDEAGNSFLRLVSSGWDNAGYKYSHLISNFSHTATSISNNWSIQYDMRLYSSDWASVTGSINGQRQSMAGLYFSNIALYADSDLPSNQLGGKYSPTNSRTDWEGMRIRWDTLTDNLPLNTTCNLSDNVWHRVTYIVTYDTGSLTYKNKKLYIDSNLCYEDNVTMNKVSSLGNWKFVNYQSRGAFTIDIDNVKFYINHTTPSGLEECGDGSDNDGDGFTDYPDDPSCTSLSDNSEAPFDYVQCNNGLDDDGDGYIDYPDDPSCDNATDTSEFPADDTEQPDTVCLEEEYCLLYDKFPYNDDITLHGWAGQTSFFSSDLIYSNQRLAFNNLGTENFNFSKNISHTNVYDDVTASFVLFFDNLFESDTTLYNYYLVYKDTEDREIIRLRFDLRRATADPHIKVQMYYDNGTAYQLIATYEPDDEDVLSRALFIFSIDQVLKTFNFSISAGGTLGYTSNDLPWTNVLANKVNSFWIEQGNFSSTKWEVVMDDAEIFGSLLGQVTVCDTWELPYYLVESFNGYLADCNWLTSNEIYNEGELSVTDAISYYFAQKNTDLAEEDNVDFVTMTFDLNVINISVIGSTITFRLYDDDGFNFITAYFRDTGDYLFYNDDGTGRQAGGITLGTELPYKFVIDLPNDKWDIYINNTKVVTDSDFSDAFVNIRNIQTIKLTSNDANFELDNLKIFASDSTGSPLLPDEELEPTEVDADFIMCGYFWKNPVVCSDDEDCLTGQCNMNNRCSGFDYTYCDEKGMVRGNKCVMSAVAMCILSSTGDIILDNFFLFLILLVMLMGGVYLVIMFRRK